MFTGIIQATGSISAIHENEKDSRFVFATGKMTLDDISIGDSIAVNGACLTIIEKEVHAFTADLSRETLALTTFPNLKQGARINLEKAMQLSDRINGHMVSGHIDGMGKIVDKHDEGCSIRYSISVAEQLNKFISKKGSITVDGVSLTVNDSNAQGFSVNIIPHTLSETIFSDYEVNTMVNIEVDLIARYLAQLLPQQ